MMMSFVLVACSNSSSTTKNEKNIADTGSSKVGSEQTDKSDMENNTTQESSDKQHILIVYFSHSGNTKVIADQIHENVGGDIFEIKTVDSYPTDYNTLLNQAKKEQEQNYRPKLAAKVDNINSYDMIFIGFPDWWGTMPMPVFSILEQYDLSGKTIVPFCTHGSSGLGRSIEDIKKNCSKAKVLDGLAVQEQNVNNANKDVSDWLHKTGMIK